MTDQMESDNSSSIEDLEARIDELESIIERQQEQFEALKAQRGDENQSRGADGTDTTSVERNSSVDRRTVLHTLGLAGLVGLGTTTAAGSPQGSIGTDNRPLETVYTETINGGVTGEEPLDTLAGGGLDIAGGELTVSGGWDQVEFEGDDLLTPSDGAVDGIEIDLMRTGTNDMEFSVGVYGDPVEVARFEVGDEAGDDIYPNVILGTAHTRDHNRGTAIGGGRANTVAGQYATIGGGRGNDANEFGATVGGGTNNVTDGSRSTIAGGRSNQANGPHSAVGGGRDNQANGEFATISGGGPIDPVTDPEETRNVTYDDYTTVGGGGENQAGDESSSAPYATVSGGQRNEASGFASTVGGGDTNQATHQDTVVAGGTFNEATDIAATVCGGNSNKAHGGHSFIGGGSSNVTAPGEAYTAIPGGRDNETNADYAFAMGHSAKANHDGAFVVADSSNDDATSERPNEARFQVSITAENDVQFENERNGDTVETQQLTAGPVANGIVDKDGGSWRALNTVNVVSVEDGNNNRAEIHIDIDEPTDPEELMAVVTPWDESDYPSLDALVSYIELDVDADHPILVVNQSSINIDKFHFAVYHLPDSLEI